MKKILFVFLVLFMFIPFTNVFAGQSNQATITAEDLLKNPNISSEVRETIVQAINKQQGSQTIVNIEKAYEWKDFVKVFAEAIKEVCHILNVEVNDFVKTPVGKMTAILIGYKIFGKDLIEIVSSVGAAMFIISFYFIICWRLYGRRKVINKDKTIKYEPYITICDNSNDNKITKFTVFIIASIFCLVASSILIGSIG